MSAPKRGGQAVGRTHTADVKKLKTELAEVQVRLEELRTLIRRGGAAQLISDEAVRLETRAAELYDLIDAAEAEEAKPVAESWREMRELCASGGSRH